MTPELCIVGGFCSAHGTADLHAPNGARLTVCDQCGAVYGIGCSPFCRDGHAPVSRHYGDGFEAYFDYGLGQEVTGWGDVRKAMRENHLDFKDHPSPGETAARRDRLRERQRQETGR